MKKALPSLKVVEGLDLKRYLGRWYEIAMIPSGFQPKNGTNTRATYTEKSNGEVGVLNETFINGKRQSIQGKAWLAHPNDPAAKLVVRFWVPPFLPLFPVHGDYWVLALDKEKYSYALIGQPSRKNLWILSRKPTLDEETYRMLCAVAEEQGYNPAKLKRTEHVPGVGDGETEVGSFEGGRLERTAVAAAVVAVVAGALSVFFQQRSSRTI